jgi:hypothetical protein
MISVADGKIVPGAIEATVVADQSGQDYNIAPTTFTIPGFEGSPKHDKFSAQSKNAMSGGGTSGSDMTSISDQDIADAKKSVEAEMKDTAIQIVNQNVSSGEKALSETVETSVIASSASPQSGAVTNSFDYRVKFHVRAFIFSEDDMKTMIVDLLAKQDTVKIPSLSTSMIDVQYGEPTVDYKAGTLHINAHAEARSGSDLDQKQLKDDLLGQSESDIADLLKKYTQIDSISIELWPEFVSNRIPTRVNRVTIIVDPLNK